MYRWLIFNDKFIQKKESGGFHITMLSFLFSALPVIPYTIDNTVAEGDMIAVVVTERLQVRQIVRCLAFWLLKKKVHFKQMLLLSAYKQYDNRRMGGR